MGRHRRSAAGRAATGRATGVTETQGFSTESHGSPDSYPGYHPAPGTAPYLNSEENAEANARSDAYLFASEEDYAAYRGEAFTPDDGARQTGSRRRKKRAATPMKTGLLGVSAAVALGTVAVATGAVPGLQSYKLGGGSSSSADNVQAADSPTNSATEQGGTSGSVESREDDTSTSRDAERSASPSSSPSSSPSPSPSTSSATPTQTPSKKPTATPSEQPTTTPSRSRAAVKAPEQTSAPVTVSAESAAAAEVLKLVNQERAQVGCSAVAANSALADLAQAFSEDMAKRDFFDHTDPDGRSPWDRAAKAGITDLGGENIARGQADAAAVMEAWMNSPGHKANILNCDFKTLGVGVHLGSGGPWWTQDFGY